MIKWAIEHVNAQSFERHELLVHLSCDCGVESDHEVLYESPRGIVGAFGTDTVEHALRHHSCPHTEEALLELWER